MKKLLFTTLLAGFMTMDLSLAADQVATVKLENGMTVPQLGCGVWELSETEAYDSVSMAIKHGYRLIDTAQYYKNEKATYNAVRDSGIDRDEFFITTKLWPRYATEQDIRMAIDTSLENLGGRIDLMLIHWPYSHDELAWKVMEDYVKKGSIRAIGLSNYTGEKLSHILKIATIKPVVNQIELHPYNPRTNDIKENLDNGITVEAWSPLGAGRLHLLADETIIEIAKKYHKSAAQIILRWDIQKGVITIPRSTKENHLKENIDIFDFSLSKEDMEKIDALAEVKGRALW